MIYELGQQILNEVWRGQPVYQIQVTALAPQPVQLQADLFANDDVRRIKLNATLDQINQRYGELTLAPASLLKSTKMTNVISPAWKPSGHRQTV